MWKTCVLLIDEVYVKYLFTKCLFIILKVYFAKPITTFFGLAVHVWTSSVPIWKLNLYFSSFNSKVYFAAMPIMAFLGLVAHVWTSSLTILRTVHFFKMDLVSSAMKREGRRRRSKKRENVDNSKIVLFFTYSLNLPQQHIFSLWQQIKDNLDNSRCLLFHIAWISWSIEFLITAPVVSCVVSQGGWWGGGRIPRATPSPHHDNLLSFSFTLKF